MSLKNPVTPPGIDSWTIWLVAQRLNHHATPGPCIQELPKSNLNWDTANPQSGFACNSSVSSSILLMIILQFCNNHILPDHFHFTIHKSFYHSITWSHYWQWHNINCLTATQCHRQEDHKTDIHHHKNLRSWNSWQLNLTEANKLTNQEVQDNVCNDDIKGAEVYKWSRKVSTVCLPVIICWGAVWRLDHTVMHDLVPVFSCYNAEQHGNPSYRRLKVCSPATHHLRCHNYRLLRNPVASNLVTNVNISNGLIWWLISETTNYFCMYAMVSATSTNFHKTLYVISYTLLTKPEDSRPLIPKPSMDMIQSYFHLLPVL